VDGELGGPGAAKLTIHTTMLGTAGAEAT